MELEHIKALQEQIVFSGQQSANVELERAWDNGRCRFWLHNKGTSSAAIKEVILFGGTVDLPGDRKFYGEGYNILSQYGGSIESPQNIGAYGDADHYRLFAKDGYVTVYNMVLLYGENKDCDLIGFSSCRRFSNEIRIAPGKIELVLDTECLIIEGGETWELEDMFFAFGEEREAALDAFAAETTHNHPRLLWENPPTGWCSWLSYGPWVSEENIMDTLKSAKETQLPLTYIQIDDGYQPYMGDWLMESNTFSCDMGELCRKIKETGYEPAMWIAPFIAEKDSKLFKEHPDWFIQDEEGHPLASDKVSFGGWRRGPWYMLDGTHPAAGAYIVHVFRTMREEWGCHYFKLDATVWGALPFGRRYDKKATRVTAYRQGMLAVLEGAGEDCFLVGGNSPMWPSLGTMHAMRVTNDCARKWERLKSLAKENFHRIWQHERLWINDPDCVLLENLFNPIMGAGGEAIGNKQSEVTEDEFSFHRAVILASGSMVLSGDRLTEVSQVTVGVLKKLLEGAKEPAVFEDITFKIGRIKTASEETVCVFNWEDEPVNMVVLVGSWKKGEDYWTGEYQEFCNGTIEIEHMPAHSARVFRLY